MYNLCTSLHNTLRAYFTPSYLDLLRLLPYVTQYVQIQNVFGVLYTTHCNWNAHHHSRGIKHGVTMLSTTHTRMHTRHFTRHHIISYHELLIISWMFYWLLVKKFCHLMNLDNVQHMIQLRHKIVFWIHDDILEKNALTVIICTSSCTESARLFLQSKQTRSCTNVKYPLSSHFVIILESPVWAINISIRVVIVFISNVDKNSNMSFKVPRASSENTVFMKYLVFASWPRMPP